MCGICGIFGRENEGLVRKMVNALKHRGPDDEGYFLENGISLGVKRLSIIDLKRGHQPIFNEEGSMCVIHNGEIYNYKDLRGYLIQKGHEFKTQSDTEIIIHAYEEFGENCVKYLRGMFAFAIWDNSEKKLFLARDRFGIKPLVYTKVGDKFLFASEVKGIFQDDEVPRKIDKQTLIEEYIFTYPIEDSTLFKGVKQLLPGHTLTLTSEELKFRKYWETIFCPKKKSSERTIIKQLLKLLEESVQMQMVSDVPIGVLSSGGVDSSAIISIVNKFSENSTKTFTLSDSVDNPDIKHARTIAEHLDTDHYEFIVSARDGIERFPQYIFSSEDVEYHGMFSFLLSEKVRKYIKVALYGEGADEIFAGYDYYKNIEGHKNYLVKRWGKFSCLKGRFIRYKYLTNLLRNMRGTNNLNVLLSHDFRNQLLNNRLKQGDHNSMAFGLEARVPYLDTEVVHFVSKLSPNVKINKGVGKYILKRMISKLKLPKIIKEQEKRIGPLTFPSFIQELKEVSSELITDEYVKKHKYEKFFHNKTRLLCFDLLYHFFIENKTKVPKGFTIFELY